MNNPFTNRRIEEIKKKLARWESELPKLIQPEREHVQNIHDVNFLLNLIKQQDTTIKQMKDAAFEARWERE